MNHIKIIIALLIVIICFHEAVCGSNSQLPVTASKIWRFAVIGDSHVGDSDTLAEMIPFMLADSIDFLLGCGDIVEGGLSCSAAQLKTQLLQWKDICAPLYQAGIGIYVIRGNHENDARNNISVWNEVFSGQYALPQNGPSGELNLTYSFNHKNALLIGLDEYVNTHTVNQSWLNQQLEANTATNIFVFGHEPAFKVFHADCLDDSTAARNTFWASLARHRVKVYFCGHDHFLDIARIDDGDGNQDNDVYQYLTGAGGGWLMSQYSNYNGVNDLFSPVRIYHGREHGYSLVEISSDDNINCGVTITWKKRAWDTTAASFIYKADPNILRYETGSVTQVASDRESINPQSVSLSQNFPNPFNNATNIRYTIEEPALVQLKIFDLLGNEIQTLVNQSKPPGIHTAAFNANRLAGGMYFYQLRAGNIVLTKKLVLLK